jgi:catalase
VGNSAARRLPADRGKGGPQADAARYQPVGWHADGDMVRSAYTLHEQDDDWGQPGTMVREVLDDAARDRLVSNIVGHLAHPTFSASPVTIESWVT